MHLEIVDRDEIMVVGVRTVMEMGEADIAAVWRDKFLPRQSEVAGADHRYYGVFNVIPDELKDGRFEFVAGVVSSLENVPVGMVCWIVPEGKYVEAEAVGLTGIRQVCRDVVTEWLPDSGYKMVFSPMFAYTGDAHPDSERATWKVNIPVETPEVLEQLEKWRM